MTTTDAPCAPGYRDDDWWLFVPARCELLQPAKDALNAVGLALVVLAMGEMFVSRYVLRRDKAPTTVAAGFALVMTLIGGSLVYQLAVPRSSVARVPDFYWNFVTLYLTTSATIVVSLAVGRHFIGVARHLLRTVLDRDATKNWARWVALLQVAAWFTVGATLTANVPLMVVLPALHVGDPERQNVFISASYAVLAGFSAVYGVILYTAFKLTHDIVQRQVASVQSGGTAPSDAAVDLSKAREQPATAGLVDLVFRLRFNMTATLNNFVGQLLLWAFSAAYGQRWYINHIATILAVVSVELISIALFRPALLPRFLGGHLGLIGPIVHSTGTGTATGTPSGSTHQLKGLGASASAEFVAPLVQPRQSSGSIDIVQLHLERGLVEGVNELESRSEP